MNSSHLIRYKTGLSVFATTAFISLRLLLQGNMGVVNEVDVLPLAKQWVDPTWIPTDWYLNQPAGYRFLFNNIFGKLILIWGFLATSIIGRLLCYGLIALALVRISQRLGLRFPMLLAAIGLFLYRGGGQGAIAQEWLLHGLEAKAVAYGFVLLAIGLMLEGRYRLMALMLGLATSFHVLVGGWSFLAALGWLLWNRRLKSFRQIVWIILLGMIGGAFAIKPALAQLFTIAPTGSISPSFIYVFLRLSHHLNPLSWTPDRWLRPVIYLLMLGFSTQFLRKRQSDITLQQYQACMGLFEFTLISLIPFLLGLIIAPFDYQGSFLQFYFFRLGDVMLPLNACLLLACALQTFATRQKQLLFLGCVGLLVWMCSIQSATFVKQVSELKQFPKLNSNYEALCEWIHTHTLKDVVVISSPVGSANFTWLTERATVAKYKLMPQTKTGILEWYERLGDLAGGTFPQPNQPRIKDNRRTITRELRTGYYHLTTAQVVALMDKYQASYFMTRKRHQLNLPIAYRNSSYILYQQQPSLLKPVR